MKSRLAFLLTPVVLAATACKKEVQAPQLPPPLVMVSNPLVRDVPFVAEIIAQTEAKANVEVRARVEGTVEKIAFSEGSEVKEGDLLFVLDRQPIEERLAAAKGNLGQVTAALARAKLDVERLTPLVEKQAVPRKDLDNAKSAVDSSESAMETARAQVRSAELDLTYTEIKAPVSGLIGSKQVDVGSLVGKGQATLMATISPLDPIWANADVSEVAYLNAADKFSDPQNSKAVFSLLQANGQVHGHTGKLAFVDRSVNSATGTLKVRVEFPNPEKILRPGQFCRLRVVGRTDAGAILLPQRAVQELQGLHNVFVVDASGKVSFKRVKMGRRIGPLWIVESGLTGTDTVIIEGLQKARDGQPVTPQPTKIDDAPVLELLASVPGAKAETPSNK